LAVKVRTLLIGTAFVSAILGAVVAYLVLTVPNDLQAAALMQSAKKQIADGDGERARGTLSRVIQQYPRTDAAAAASVALFSLAENERRKLTADLEALRRANDIQGKQLAALTDRTQSIENRPPPAPVIVREPAPPPPAKKPPAKKPAVKKPAAKKPTKRR
jgi:hypothetical protein